MNSKDQKIVDAIMFLKEKEKVSVREIAQHLSLGYNLASKVVDVLEKNNIISEFKGETHREVIADKSIFESEFIFLDINDFIYPTVY